MSHNADCPDPCRHDNECPHGKANVDGETCPLCTGPLSELSADWKVIRRLTDAIHEAVDNAVEWLLDEHPEVDQEDEELLQALSDRVFDLATGREDS